MVDQTLFDEVKKLLKSPEKEINKSKEMTPIQQSSRRNRKNLLYSEMIQKPKDRNAEPLSSIRQTPQVKGQLQSNQPESKASTSRRQSVGGMIPDGKMPRNQQVAGSQSLQTLQKAAQQVFQQETPASRRFIASHASQTSQVKIRSSSGLGMIRGVAENQWTKASQVNPIGNPPPAARRSLILPDPKQVGVRQSMISAQNLRVV